MDKINQVGSPMDLLDESLDEAPDKVRLRKQQLEAKQRTKSPFLIGSIEEVNKKIILLDQKLKNYTQLVCESRSSNDDDEKFVPKSARRRDEYQKREKEAKEVCKFAEIYTLKSTSFPTVSIRAKNISKITMKPQTKRSVVSGDNGKPKFVELHQYPGFDPEVLIPLPSDLTPHEIFSKVVDVSLKLTEKMRYKAEFERLFFCQMSEAILLDVFWYVFLEKFQPSRISQSQLFNRVAHNYIELLMSCSDLFVKDIFFKAHPKLLSKAVYSSFCFSFPDSYTRFGEKFKDDLIYLVYAWFAGIHPSPRSWLTWEMSSLEPPNLKKREEMMKRKKGNSLIDFDYLDSLIANNASQSTSTMSIAQSTSKSSTASNVASGKLRLHARISKVDHKPSIGISSPNKSQPSSSSQESNVIEAVSTAQRRSNKGGKDTKLALTPIREMADDEEAEWNEKYSQIFAANQRKDKKGGTYEMASHPLGRGCDFVYTTFITQGKTPLVAHFLRMKGLQRDAGQMVSVQRVEVENLPALDAKTYKDVIAESSRNIQKKKRNFQELYRSNLRHSHVFLKQQRASLREHMCKQSSLLANQREVKRLSDLIIMEQRRSKDSVSAGADAAVEAALMAQV